MIDMISLHPQELGATTVRQNCIKNGLQIPVDHCYAERARGLSDLQTPLGSLRKPFFTLADSSKTCLLAPVFGVTLG